MRKTIRVAAATVTLALGGLGLVACSQQHPCGRRRRQREPRQGPVRSDHRRAGQGQQRRPAALHGDVEQAPPGPEGHVQGAVRPGRPAAERPAAALPAEADRLRRGLHRRGLDPAARVAGLPAAADRRLQARRGRASSPPCSATAKYRGVQYAAPSATDSQILYYRKDWLGDKPVPKTYEEMFKLCDIAKAKGAGCYSGQFAKYEGLTVNFAEAVNSAGGTIVDDKGQPTLDTPEAKAGLQTLVDAYKNGEHPEGRDHLPGGAGPPGLRGREADVLHELALRLQPDHDGLDDSFASKDKKALGIAGFPGKSSLGGHNWAISAFSKHKGTALEFLKWSQTADIQKFGVEKTSSAPGAHERLRRHGAADEVPVPAGAEGLAGQRGAAPRHAVLPGGLDGHPEQRLRGAAGQRSRWTRRCPDMSTAIKQAGGS